MLATDLIAYLFAEGFTVYPDPNFIPANLPENKYPCLFVFGTGGFAPHQYVPTERPTFQVYVKGKSYKSDPFHMGSAEALAKSLIRHLHRRANFQIGSVQVFSCLASQSSPIYLGLDEGDRPLFSTNFTFYLREA